MDENYDVLVKFIAQLYKVGIRIEKFNIDKDMIIKFSIPQESYLYNDDIKYSQQALITEVNETLNKLFNNSLYKLQLLYRIRDEKFTQEDGISAYKNIIVDFKNSDFISALQQMVQK